MIKTVIIGIVIAAWGALGRRSINARRHGAGQSLTQTQVVVQMIAGPVRVDRLVRRIEEFIDG